MLTLSSHLTKSYTYVDGNSSLAEFQNAKSDSNLDDPDEKKKGKLFFSPTNQKKTPYFVGKDLNIDQLKNHQVA